MKTAFFTSPQHIQITETPRPEICSDNDVLVHIQKMGISDVDLMRYSQGTLLDHQITYPATLGHIGSGVVEAMGANAGRYLTEGQVVMINPAISCGLCDQCRKQRPHTCRHLKFVGISSDVPGCGSEYVIFPAQNCLPAEPSLKAEDVVMAEPLAITLYALSCAGLFNQNVYMDKLSTMGLIFRNMEQSSKWVTQPTSSTVNRVLEPWREKNSDITLVICGASATGLSAIMCARLLGIKKIYVLDSLDTRLNIARKLGALWVGNPANPTFMDNHDCDHQHISSDTINNIIHFMTQEENVEADVILECSGTSLWSRYAHQLLRPGGTLVQVGIPNENQISFPAFPMMLKEINWVNTCYQNYCLRPVLDWIGSGDLNPKELITHHFPLEKIQDAYQMALLQQDNVIRAVINMDHV